MVKVVFRGDKILSFKNRPLFSMGLTFQIQKESYEMCLRQTDEHLESRCTNELHCVNCGEKHSADSKECRIWHKDKEILRLKFTRNISFVEARKLVEAPLPIPGISYANITHFSMKKVSVVNTATQTDPITIIHSAVQSSTTNTNSQTEELQRQTVQTYNGTRSQTKTHIEEKKNRGWPDFLYIPPNFHLETEHLDTLLKQLHSPYILVGDFNGHNILCGCKGNNPKGNIIEDFITKNDLCLMNDKSHTYLHPATGKFSSLDLSMCHPSLLLDFDWMVSGDQHGSDHFPVIIESVNNSTNDHNAKWKLNKENWELYHSLCEESLKIDKFNNSLDPLDDFTSSLLDIFNKSIPKTSTNPKKSKPWYNDECKDAIKQRKQALSKFCRYPTKENLNNVKNFKAKARRTIKASKRKSYVSNLNHKTPIKKVTLTSRLGLDDMSLAWPAVVQLLVFIYSGIQ